ncbi:Putative large exoprotein involved in heme utilization or adhesion of ShlA/HecA/FhaA family [plant metagenome]|uniref:Large exoprotein involved in heme utilization or adhesion of ShlA/HecA/FhaA family n=1 Tax=plant metagenome TaxID=1297885 RepID=A0A484P347_9ZZZZ
MGLPVALSASGNASSTTRSGISEGVIEIRDEAGQQALTGKSAAETIASLNRDTTDTLGGAGQGVGGDECFGVVQMQNFLGLSKNN